MNQDRPVCHRLTIFQHRQQNIEIMSIDRPDIVKAEFLEQSATHGKAAKIFFSLLGRYFEANRFDNFLRKFPQATIRP